MFVFVVGGVFGMGFAMRSIGGFDGMLSVVAESNLTGFLDIIRPIDAPEFSPIGMFVGQLIASSWYWCIDQEMVQRILAAKSEKHAKGGTLFAGFFKIVPVFMIIFPGMASRLLYEQCKQNPTGVSNIAWCNTNLSQTEESNKAYPYLIIYEFPIGVIGLISASLLAAMMSSLSSVFNSASTIFTIDIYQRFIRPTATEKEIVMAGRGSTIGMTLLGLAWIPVIQAQKGQLYLVSQNVMTHISPTLTTIFFLGVFWHRINGPGALIGMVSGVVIGLSRLIAYFVLTSSGAICPRDGFLWLICSDFNLFAILLSSLVAIITIVSSLLTKAPNRTEVHQHIYHYPNWCCLYCLNGNEHIALNGNEQDIDIEPTENEANRTRTQSDFVEIDTNSDESNSSVALDQEQIPDEAHEPPKTETEQQSGLEIFMEKYVDTILNILAMTLISTTISLIVGFSGIFY